MTKNDEHMEQRAREVAHNFVKTCRGGERAGREHFLLHTPQCNRLTHLLKKFADDEIQIGLKAWWQS